MNFNISYKPDYDLNTNLIDELIRLYGTKVRWVQTDKIASDSSFHEDFIRTPDSTVFNDFKTVKTARTKLHKEMWVLLAEPESYGSGFANVFNNFGMINEDTLQVYVSLRSLEFLERSSGVSNSAQNSGIKTVHPKDLVSTLMVFPSGKIMEITDCQLHVPSVNNTFVYSDRPSCYQISLKSYNFDRSAVDLRVKNDHNILKAPQPLHTLEGYGDSLDITKHIKKFAGSDENIKALQTFESMKDSNGNSNITATGKSEGEMFAEMLGDMGSPLPSSSLDDFFNQQDIESQLVKQSAVGEALTIKCGEEVSVPGARIDDVFGTF